MAPKLLIIGGGFAGVHCAKGATAAGYEVTVVDKKDFFDVKFASLRASVKPAAAEGYIFKYSEIPGLGSFKQASVTNFSKDSAELSTGEVLKFDFAVLCTGSTNGAGPYAQPQGTAITQRKEELSETSESVKNAKKIVIVGAGAVGVELAAEIVEAYAGKDVTLISSGSKLFEGRPDKLGRVASEWLKTHGVKVLFGEKATDTGEGMVKLSSGKTVPSDLTITTVGAKPNTDFLRASDLSSVLDTNGRVKVDASFRVLGYPNIFALGDISDMKEEKLGYFAIQHGQLTAKNLKALLKNNNAKLDEWKSPKAMFLSLGASAGTGHLGGCVFPSCMVAGQKSKDLFIGKVRSELGVK